jgi:hypothetical protein
MTKPECRINDEYRTRDKRHRHRCQAQVLRGANQKAGAGGPCPGSIIRHCFVIRHSDFEFGFN